MCSNTKRIRILINHTSIHIYIYIHNQSLFKYPILQKLQYEYDYKHIISKNIISLCLHSYLVHISQAEKGKSFESDGHQNHPIYFKICACIICV